MTRNDSRVMGVVLPQMDKLSAAVVLLVATAAHALVIGQGLYNFALPMIFGIGLLSVVVGVIAIFVNPQYAKVPAYSASAMVVVYFLIKNVASARGRI